MPSSLEIAQAATLRPIGDVADELGLLHEEVEPYGRYKAKVDLSVIDRLADRPDAKLINVTAITPTPAGEGKTTTSVSLTQGLGKLGRKPVLCLREASLGPVFGVKGGAAGGGYAQVVPMEDLNLHFTGDLHAITAANNLLAALIDAHLHHGNASGLDPLAISWRRCMDMNDRNLRNVVTGLGGRAHGAPRETGFDITAASEIMGLVAVARDLADLRERLGRITVGQTYEGEPVTAEDIKAAGAMAVVLKDAIKPNLVQTLEGQPAFVHCGPFANIAHGNNSLVADRVGLKLGEYVITESGFASDMGMEKFFDITCRIGELRPSAVVLVATVRALKHHGGDLEGGVAEIETGAANLARHIGIVNGFGLQAVVGVNKFPTDTADELELVRRLAIEAGAYAAEINTAFEDGGAGATALAEAVVAAADEPNDVRLRVPARRADRGEDPPDRDARLRRGRRRAAPAGEEEGCRLGRLRPRELPICMAKTHLSLSHDPALKNAPTGFTVTVRDLRPYTGAGWIVALCGDMMTMPGLGKTPAAFAIDIDAAARRSGLVLVHAASRRRRRRLPSRAAAARRPRRSCAESGRREPQSRFALIGRMHDAVRALPGWLDGPPAAPRPVPPPAFAATDRAVQVEPPSGSGYPHGPMNGAVERRSSRMITTITTHTIDRPIMNGATPRPPSAAAGSRSASRPSSLLSSCRRSCRCRGAVEGARCAQRRRLGLELALLHDDPADDRGDHEDAAEHGHDVRAGGVGAADVQKSVTVLAPLVVREAVEHRSSFLDLARCGAVHGFGW